MLIENVQEQEYYFDSKIEETYSDRSQIKVINTESGNS